METIYQKSSKVDLRTFLELKKLSLVSLSRYFLGTMLFIFGINKFFLFLPMFVMPEAATKLMLALFDSGYLMHAVGVVEALAGIGILFNRLAPLSLVILAPISVNLVLFHAFLDWSNILPAIVVAGLNSFLIYYYRDKFLPIIR